MKLWMSVGSGLVQVILNALLLAKPVVSQNWALDR